MTKQEIFDLVKLDFANTYNISVDDLGDNILADNITPVSGGFGEITYINAAGTGQTTSSNLTFKDDTLRANGVFQVNSNFEWNGTRLKISNNSNIYIDIEGLDGTIFDTPNAGVITLKEVKSIKK